MAVCPLAIVAIADGSNIAQMRSDVMVKILKSVTYTTGEKRGGTLADPAPSQPSIRRRGMSVEVERKHDADLRPVIDRRRLHVIDRRRRRGRDVYRLRLHVNHLRLRLV